MKITLQKKIFFLISTLVICIVIFFSMYSLRTLSKQLQSSFMEKGKILVSNLARTVQGGVLIEDSVLLHEAIDVLFEDDDIVYVSVYNTENIVLANKAIFEDYTPAPTKEPVETLLSNELLFNDTISLLDFRFPVIFPDDEELLGYVSLGLSMESVNQEITRSGKNSLYLMLVFIGLGSLCSFILSKSVSKRTIGMVQTLNELSTGNLNVQFTGQSHDEIGEMTNAFNAFIQQLRTIQIQVQETVHSVNTIADTILQEMNILTTQLEQQSRSIDQTGESIQGIDQFIHVIGSDTNEIRNAAEQNLSAIQQIRLNIREVSANAGDLAASLHQISSFVEHINHSALDVSQNAENLGEIVQQTETEIQHIDRSMNILAQNADNARLLADETQGTARNGQISVEASIQGIAELKDIVANTAQVIEEVNAEAEQVHSILDIVNEIAEQTSLLALNASIISAQAGEHGKGFGVVSDEIKELATRTKDSTKEITSLINTLQEKTRDSVKSVANGLQKADQGVQLVSVVKESLHAILDSATRSSTMAADTAKITQQTASSSQIIGNSINSVSSMVVQISEAIQQQQQDISRVATEVEGIHEMSEHVNSASIEQLNTSEHIAKSVELTTERFNNISAQTEKLQQNSQQIVTAVHTIESVTESILQETRKISGVTVQELVQQGEVLQHITEEFKVS